MGYKFRVANGCRVKKDGEYPWPCESEPNRTIELFTDDVLTKNAETGKYIKHTGLGCFNIVLEDNQVTEIDGNTWLEIL